MDERLKEGAALGGDTCHAAQGGVAGDGLVQRAQLALERERVEHMGAFWGVHQQQRHAALLLLGIKILRQAVKQPERQVAGAVGRDIRTGVARRAQEQSAQQPPPEVRAPDRRVIDAAALKGNVEAALPLAGELAEKLDGERLMLLDIGHRLQQMCPHAR